MEAKHYINIMEYASKNVIKVNPDASLADVAKIMTEYNIRHVPVVSEDNRPLGLVGLREVSEVLLEGGKEGLEREKVVDHMNDQPVKVTTDVSLLKGVELMLEAGVGSVIIVDELDNIKAILTERDVVKFLASIPSIEAVGDIASPISTYVLPGSSMREVLELMLEMWERYLVFSKGNKIVGVISMFDIVKRSLEEDLSAPVDDVVRQVEVLPPEAPISYAAALMISKNREALLVGRKEPTGLVGEKNMVRGALEVLSKI